MALVVHKIDPNGDTLLILRNPNAPFAAGDANVWPNAIQKYRSESLRRNERVLVELAKSERPTTDSTREIHFQLSSKHLTLTSEYFRGLMANNWREASSSRDFAYSVTAEDWDETALLMVMNTIHCQTAEIPRVVDPELVAKIAVIVDYYQCHKAVSFYAVTWIKNFDTKHISSCSYGRKLLLRLFISCVFVYNSEFQLSGKIILYECRGPIHSLGLPFPQIVIDRFEVRRKRHVSKVITRLYMIVEELIEGNGACSSECSSISLGALMKAMKGMGLFEPKPAPPFEGYSLEAMRKALRAIEWPDYQLIARSTSKHHLDTCYLWRRIRQSMGKEFTADMRNIDVSNIDMSKKS